MWRVSRTVNLFTKFIHLLASTVFTLWVMEVWRGGQVCVKVCVCVKWLNGGEARGGAYQKKVHSYQTDLLKWACLHLEIWTRWCLCIPGCSICKCSQRCILRYVNTVHYFSSFLSFDSFCPSSVAWSFAVSPLVSTPLAYLGLCSCCQEKIKRLWTLRHIHKHQLSLRLVPRNCSSSTISALPPALCIHELLPCHFRSLLNELQSDLSKWRNVKMLVSGLMFHLHWQLEEHNSAPGGSFEAQKKVLHSDSTIQSGDRPQLYGDPEKEAFLSGWITLLRSLDVETETQNDHMWDF